MGEERGMKEIKREKEERGEIEERRKKIRIVLNKRKKIESLRKKKKNWEKRKKNNVKKINGKGGEIREIIIESNIGERLMRRKIKSKIERIGVVKGIKLKKRMVGKIRNKRNGENGGDWRNIEMFLDEGKLRGSKIEMIERKDDIEEKYDMELRGDEGNERERKRIEEENGGKEKRDKGKKNIEKGKKEENLEKWKEKGKRKGKGRINERNEWV